ncbi:hypothetical protein LTR56_026261 [Elasticomyces elasticus]|nr:hypothetical protein LTR56_026261 [Elasticomyces elasticus]
MGCLATGVAATVVGVVTHAFYFNKYECHMHAILYIQLFLASWTTSILAFILGPGWEIGEAVAVTSIAASCFLAGTYGSLLTYRIFLNPLNRFPGPWTARLSSFFWTLQLGNSDAHLRLQALHKKYGSIVRIGSADLSVIDPAGMEITYGADTKVTKASWYDNNEPLTSMHTARSRVLHDRRRKIWAPAFSDRAIRAYEPIIDGFNDKILKRIREFEGTPVNVSKWFNLYSFDAMGSLAFGKDYHMLDSGEKHPALQLLSEGMQPLAYFIPSWLFRLLVSIPGLASGFHKFEKFSVDELGWKVEHAHMVEQEGRQDIMSWLLKPYKPTDKPQHDHLLQADTRLIIVAGVCSASGSDG